MITWLHVLVCINYAIWLALSSTCYFLTDNSLQSADKDQQEMRVLAEKLHDGVVKFDTYRNLQRHRAVLLAIARHLVSRSYWYPAWCGYWHHDVCPSVSYTVYCGVQGRSRGLKVVTLCSLHATFYSLIQGFSTMMSSVKYPQPQVIAATMGNRCSAALDTRQFRTTINSDICVIYYRCIAQRLPPVRATKVRFTLALKSNSTFWRQRGRTRRTRKL